MPARAATPVSEVLRAEIDAWTCGSERGVRNRSGAAEAGERCRARAYVER